MRRKGVKYEERAQEYLADLYGDAYVPSPWFQYQNADEDKARYCQPDGLLFESRLQKVVIVEVKLRHTSKAWWQLRRKYGPLLHQVFPWMEVAYVELVQWYDVDTAFPEAVHLRPRISQARSNEIQVTIWKP